MTFVSKTSVALVPCGTRVMRCSIGLDSGADDGETVLRWRSFAILQELMQQPGLVISREQLEECLYGWGKKSAAMR